MVSLDSLKGSKLPSSYSADDSDENITNQARTKNKKGGDRKDIESQEITNPNPSHSP